MTNKQRLDLIERYIREHRYADLHTLAARFSISLSTVRRALDQLAEQGVLRRHHGGASLIETDELAREYDSIASAARQAGEKYAIARGIAALVHPAMTIIPDGHTSAYAPQRIVAAES